MQNVLKSIPHDKLEFYRQKAEYLIDRGYVGEIDVDTLAKAIYNKDINSEKEIE